MFINIVSASNTILWYFFLFFLLIDLYFLIPAVIAQFSSSIEELLIPIETTSKETKAGTEIYPINAKPIIRKWPE